MLCSSPCCVPTRATVVEVHVRDVLSVLSSLPNTPGYIRSFDMISNEEGLKNAQQCAPNASRFLKLDSAGSGGFGFGDGLVCLVASSLHFWRGF